MARRKAAPKRAILPDPLFESELVAKFINVVMYSGKKSVAEKIVYGAFEKVVERNRGKAKADDEEGGEGSSGSGSIGGATIRDNAGLRKKAIELFDKVLDTVSPTVEVKSRRIGGATYQVPIEVKPGRRVALAMRWLTDAASKRGEKTMALRLAGEIMDALNGRGGAIKKRETVHSMAKANQAFAHFRW